MGQTKSTETAQQAILAASQRLDSVERVSAFLAQSRMMVAVYRACQPVRLNSRYRVRLSR
jgi:hypothetical protein